MEQRYSLSAIPGSRHVSGLKKFLRLSGFAAAALWGVSCLCAGPVFAQCSVDDPENCLAEINEPYMEEQEFYDVLSSLRDRLQKDAEEGWISAEKKEDDAQAEEEDPVKKKIYQKRSAAVAKAEIAKKTAGTLESTSDAELLAAQEIQTSDDYLNGDWLKMSEGSTTGLGGAAVENTAEFADWNVPVKKQTVSGIQERFVIDETIHQARQAQKDLETALVEIPEVQPPVYDIRSDQDIIRGVIPESHLLQKIDLEFDRVPLSSIMGTLGSAIGVNIMVDSKVADTQMSLQLKKVFLEEALLLVARSQNLGYEKIGDTLYVASRADLEKDREVSRVIRLQNIKAEQAKIMIRDFVKSVSVSEELNSLIVSGSAEQLIKAVGVIADIDIPQAQVILEAKIIEIAKDASHELGIDWSDSISIGLQESQRPTDLPTQVDSAANPFRVFRITRNALTFAADINMLEKKGKARILSNPRITTMNEKLAEIFVGEKYPYIVTNVDGGVTTESVQFENLGIVLKITPSIIEDDFVVVQVEPEVSYISGFVGNYPRVKKRSAVTYVRIKNQQPFVIGGLLDQTESTVLSRVPFLGAIPLLGNFFTHDSTEVKNSELLIVVIPTIVRGDY